MTGSGVVGLAIFLLGETVLSAAAIRREEGIAIGSVGLITEPTQTEKSTGLGPRVILKAVVNLVCPNRGLAQPTPRRSIRTRLLLEFVSCPRGGETPGVIPEDGLGVRRITVKKGRRSPPGPSRREDLQTL